MAMLSTSEFEQHLEADKTFGPCLRPGCPNYRGPLVAVPAPPEVAGEIADAGTHSWRT